MAASMADIRKAMAARYAAVPQAQKPQLRLCDDCKQPVYDSKVCSASGRYHIVDEKNTLRIGTAIIGSDRKCVEGKELMAAFEANRIRWQAARTKLVRLDNDSAQIFQSFVMHRQWALMRYGIMYGKHNAEDGSLSVHTIFEPSQHGDERTFTAQNPDKLETRADAVATLLGLVRVGIICTHPARDKSQVPLSCNELIAIAKEQSRFGDHCVIVTVGPATDQENQITADAWQATEQAVTLYRAGLIDVCDQSEQYVQSKEPLEVVLAQEEGPDGKKKPPKSMEPSHFVDTKWMTGYIAIESFSTRLFGNKFARYDRPGEEPLRLANVGAFLQAPSRASLPFADKIRDFHLLVFLAITDVFDMKTDMPALIGAMGVGMSGGDADETDNTTAAAANSNSAVVLRSYEDLLTGFIKASR